MNDAQSDFSFRCRTVWISDIHLGTRGCQADALLSMLRDVEMETLYLVGDIVDGWALKRSWYWLQSHNDVVQKVLRRARKGARVVYVPGNHDEAMRQYVGLAFGGIEIVEDAVHVTADGKRLWVLHGDQFDGVVQFAPWLALLGDRAYTVALELNRILNQIRHRLGFGYWSLSQYLKLRVKKAVNFVTDFEEALARAAKERGMDGVVCGHIHKAEIRQIDSTLYCNDGDWVESQTALIETHTGSLHVLHYAERRFDPPLPSVAAINPPQFEPLEATTAHALLAKTGVL